MSWIAYAILAYGLVAWVLPAPLALSHELGHALPALALSRQRVTVYVGRPPGRSASLGRLELRIRLLNHPRWGWFGHVEGDSDTLTRGQAVVVVAGGPFVSLLVLAALLLGAASVSWPAAILIWGPALAVAWQVLVTAVPMRYPRWFGPYAGRVSDGYRIVSLLRDSGSN